MHITVCFVKSRLVRSSIQESTTIGTFVTTFRVNCSVYYFGAKAIIGIHHSYVETQFAKVLFLLEFVVGFVDDTLPSRMSRVIRLFLDKAGHDNTIPQTLFKVTVKIKAKFKVSVKVSYE